MEKIKEKLPKGQIPEKSTKEILQKGIRVMST
jgi:hypothetical protein